jgi:hypothetical protein
MVRMLSFWALFAGLLLWSVAVKAERTDAYVAEQMRVARIPGLAIAVMKSGGIVKANGCRGLHIHQCMHPA